MQHGRETCDAQALQTVAVKQSNTGLVSLFQVHYMLKDSREDAVINNIHNTSRARLALYCTYSAARVTGAQGTVALLPRGSLAALLALQMLAQQVQARPGQERPGRPWEGVAAPPAPALQAQQGQQKQRGEARAPWGLLRWGPEAAGALVPAQPRLAQLA
jgi:hypothetical protein